MSLIWIVLGAALALGLLRLSRRPQPLPAQPLPHPQGDLSQVAWALGGSLRTINTWWVELRAAGALVERGSTGPRCPTRWGPGTPLPEGADPWIARAARAVPAGGAPAGEILKAWAPLLKDLQTQMHAEGLLATARYRSGRTALYVIGAVTGAGLALAVSLSGGTGALGWGLLTATLAVLLVQGLMAVPRLSAWGLQWQRQWAEMHAAAARAPEAGSVGWAVAVGGLAVLTGTPFAAWALGRTDEATGSGGGCGSASVGGGCSSAAATGGAFGTGGGFGGGDGGSSGCGGGGCGGGGCGS